MFGRKKKQEQEQVASDAENPNYGMDVDDESDDGSSVPPPPPGTASKSDLFKDETSKDGPGGEANGISFLTDSTDDDELKKQKEEDPNKKKKYGLIFLFIATLAILVGLTIKYAQTQPSSSASATPTGQEEDAFFDASNEAIGVDNGSIPVVTANPVQPGTVAPTDAVTDADTDLATFPGPGEMDCAINAIYASSSCSGGSTSTTITICFNDIIEDQFWQWIETPEAYQEFVEDDWGWLSDSMTIQRDDLPVGLYSVGLYSNGDQVLDEYPLIASTEFQVLCS
jgi:hypothetical protein